MQIKKSLQYFSPFEWALWLSSVAVITASYLLGESFYPLSLIASVLGVTALLFIAKGNVIGQFLVIIFSTLYGIISYNFRYYGELITYLFMTAPSAIFACITWLKNPSKVGRSEVKVATMSATKWVFVSLFSVATTVVFYFILRYFDTKNLVLSTLSVTTSMFASLLLIFRCRFYAVAYALNDIVLVGLWVLASIEAPSNLPMVFCFITFLFNDLYSFINWKRLEIKQANEEIK